MDLPPYGSPARASATMTSSQSSSATSISSEVSVNLAEVEGSNNGPLPLSTADLPAGGCRAGPVGDDECNFRRDYAAPRMLLPNSAAVVMGSPLVALSCAEVDRASDSPSVDNGQSLHTSPSTSTALPQGQGELSPHLFPCGVDQTGLSLCASSGVSSVRQGVPRQSPSLAFPLPVVPSTPLPSQPVPMTKDRRQSELEARQGPCFLCSTDSLEKPNLTRTYSISGDEHMQSRSSSAQQVFLPQRAKTSYTVHRVLPRMVHPQFTSKPHILFPKHATCRSGALLHAYTPFQYTLLTKTSQPCLRPLTSLRGTFDVEAFLCKPALAALAMKMHPMREGARRHNLTAPLLPEKPDRSLPDKPASLAPLESVASPSDDQVQAELRESESSTRHTEEVYAVMQQGKSHKRLSSALAVCNPRDDEERNISAAAAPCLVSVVSPLYKNPRYRQPHQPSVAALPKGRTLWVSGEYSTRHFQRGTWVFLLVREERLARELLEAEETSEALRCLPASWAVWRMYYCHSLCSTKCGVVRRTSNTGMGESLSSGVPTALTTSLSSSTRMLFDSSGGDNFSDEAECFSPSQRPCMDKGKGKEKHKKLPPPPPHPAFAMAAYRLELLESILGDRIRTEEKEAFHAYIEKPFKYEHRLLTVGTLPLEHFVRSWICIHRARNLRHTLQRQKLEELEQESRVALYVTSQTLHRRFQLMMMALAEQEHYYRCSLELLYTQTAAWTGVVFLHLQQQVECFSLAFGSLMSKARLCGRLKGWNLFSNLALAEQAMRDTICGEEAQQRSAFPTELEMRFVSLLEEPQALTILVDCEAAERSAMHQVVSALETHYSIREVQIEESMERQSWLKKVMQGGVDCVAQNTTPHPLLQEVVSAEATP
ncbi:hypothetical protein, conserved [Leishmania tarentolae]|uniref:Uncharacterized protein n=1 Tax=Leishmania tarentolae TaxID=5689 RepID=A0A640KSE8_LEITA|nr:hypothetical protein, conserved [Leishmania tarentolae]